MPNKYIKKKVPLYSQEDMNKALQEVKNEGLSMYAAAKKYKIPTTSLYDRVKENYNTNVVGRPVAIPWDEENILAESIRTMEKWGFGLSREEVLNLVANYVTKNKMHTPFRNNKPGKDWFINFRKRHRLSIKKAQPVEYVRKKMTDPFIVLDYFKLLDDTLTSLNIHDKPHLIWNLDETSLSLDPTRTKVVGAINKPCSRTTCGTGKENITVLTAVSASGAKLSPLIVFKGKNVWDTWMARTENYDFELSYAASRKGWMETEIFHNYMEKMLIPAVGEERPVLMIYDGHSTHVDPKVVELAIRNNVTILKLPPHTSHLLQPLDVAVFKSFKTKWDSKLVEWQRHNVGAKMPKCVFAETFAETWQKTNADVIKSGFKKAGIYPFDAQVIPADKYDPAAYRRYQHKQLHLPYSQSQVQLNSSKALKILCLDAINKELMEGLKVSFQGNTNPAVQNVVFLSKLSKTDNQNQPFIMNHTSILPECLQSNHFKPIEKKTDKINIISDQKISFEELLLEKIRQDKKENNLTKKKRIAKGAEVITASLCKKIAEETEKLKVAESLSKKRNLKGKRKDKQTSNVDIAKPGLSGIKKCKNKKKSKQQQNSDSSTISDIMSIYSETDCVDYFDEFWDEVCFDSEIKEKKDSISKAIQNENLMEHNVTGNTDKNKVMNNKDLNSLPQRKDKGKGKGKKTKMEKENVYLTKDCEIQDTAKVDNQLEIKEKKRRCTEKSYVNSEKGTEIINKINEGHQVKNEEHRIRKMKIDKITKSIDENVMDVVIEEQMNERNEEYGLNDAVLVRYFIRKKWIYYVGFIENILQDGYQTKFTINFLKTIKKSLKPYLTFVMTKKKDIDIVPDELITKKIILQKNNDKEFTLLDENDKVYFM